MLISHLASAIPGHTCVHPPHASRSACSPAPALRRCTQMGTRRGTPPTRFARAWQADSVSQAALSLRGDSKSAWRVLASSGGARSVCKQLTQSMGLFPTIEAMQHHGAKALTQALPDRLRNHIRKRASLHSQGRSPQPPPLSPSPVASRCAQPLQWNCPWVSQ